MLCKHQHVWTLKVRKMWKRQASREWIWWKDVVGCLRNREKKQMICKLDTWMILNREYILFFFYMIWGYSAFIGEMQWVVVCINWNLEWKRVLKKFTSSLRKPRICTDYWFRGSPIITISCIFILHSEHGYQCGFFWSTAVRFTVYHLLLFSFLASLCL